MGIPTFFLSILEKKNYKNVHSGVKNGELNCDYFFLDYNGIVYSAYFKIKKNIDGNNLTKDKIETLIIEEVIRYTKYLICDVVKPKKLTYIALDGPAPRAKMVQQRSRRYKTYFEKKYIQNEKKKLNINTDKFEWDTSANISPGTVFMHKLSESLIDVIKVKGFSTHNINMEILLSDSNFPGEGEHKFLPLIRSMRKNKSTQNANVYLYGEDADLIVLSISTHKSNMHILRKVQLETSRVMKEMYENYEFIDLNINNLGNAFNHDLTRTLENIQFDKMKILNDYIFLTFLVGNDFVVSMPFLKIRKDGLKTLIAIYHDIKVKYSEYLVIYNPDIDTPPSINLEFFKELIFELSKKEDSFMKKQYNEIEKFLRGYKDSKRLEREAILSPLEIIQSRYSHLQVCSPDHPLFNIYHEDFKKVNYKADYDTWKEEYYKFYLNIDKKNLEEYNNGRMNIVKNYLESLTYTLKYYFQGCPSWKWNYKYRISPLISDIFEGLNNNIMDVNNHHFELGKPYTPFQQLMLILPPQMNDLVPSVLRPIMTDDKLLCTQFYPIEFMIDVTTGIKTMYSEAILPEIDEELLISTVEKYEKKLTPDEIIRNTIRDKPLMNRKK